MLICVFDSETTGVRSPIHLVEVAAILLEVDPVNLDATRERASLSLIVRPDGWVVPPEAAAVHGITHERACELGVPLVVALAALTNLWAVADRRAAHNLEYDDRVIAEAIDRLGRRSTLKRPPGICTKVLSAPLVNLPPTAKMVRAGFGNRPKDPRLDEAHRFFFNDGFDGAHSALADVRACGRVLVELLRRGVKI